MFSEVIRYIITKKTDAWVEWLALSLPIHYILGSVLENSGMAH
jgi:hypothetical protein